MNPNIISKLEILEKKYLNEIKEGSFNERCNTLEKHLNIYAFPDYKYKDIYSCNSEEFLYTAMTFRLHYIENKIDITHDLLNKIQYNKSINF